jgi:peptidylprolyl isomerase
MRVLAGLLISGSLLFGACSGDDATTTRTATQTAVGTPVPSAVVRGTVSTGPQATVTPGIPPVTGEIVETASGLRYIDEVVGTGPTPTLCVSVHFSGWLEDGTRFETTEGNPPFTLPLNRVIPGWQEGMESMKEGGKRRLLIPPDLGYGPTGRAPNIPANAPLIYDIELVKVLGEPVVTEATSPAGDGKIDKIYSCPTS